MEPKERKEYEEYIKSGIITQSMIDTAKWEEKWERNRNFTISLISSTDFNDAKIANLVGVELSWVAGIRKELGK